VLRTSAVELKSAWPRVDRGALCRPGPRSSGPLSPPGRHRLADRAGVSLAGLREPLRPSRRPTAGSGGPPGESVTPCLPRLSGPSCPARQRLPPHVTRGARASRCTPAHRPPGRGPTAGIAHVWSGHSRPVVAKSTEKKKGGLFVGTPPWEQA
jgi:hypothetical protein